MHRYEGDIVAWAREQACLLREGRFSELDVEHIADEIEDVGKSEQRELVSRMGVLLAHLLKWQHQPGRRGSSWQRTIKDQRRRLERRLRQTPSLRGTLDDAEWWADMWDEAVEQAIAETGLDTFPQACPWKVEQVLDADFFPECGPGV